MSPVHVVLPKSPGTKRFAIRREVNSLVWFSASSRLHQKVAPSTLQSDPMHVTCRVWFIRDHIRRVTPVLETVILAECSPFTCEEMSLVGFLQLRKHVNDAEKLHRTWKPWSDNIDDTGIGYFQSILALLVSYWSRVSTSARSFT